MSDQRIAINTFATYAGSVFGAVLALFSSRWVLLALGNTDFGLYSVVGSIIVFITFLNNILSASAARHFAFSIGQDEIVELNGWFNAAASIHLVLAVLLVLIGWPVGEYVIGHVLSIPSIRIDACLWVFRVSLVSAFVSMLSVPFIAMFNARQRIFELAAWSMLQSILAFALAWCVLHVSGDRLLFYAIGMVSIIILSRSAQVVRALAIFKECAIVGRKLFEPRKLKAIFSFAGWNLFGNTGVLFRNQGTAILLNLFFGPTTNAAYGMASQVSRQTSQLSNAMITAFSPEVTTSEGSGKRGRMLSLSERASKLGTLFVVLLAVPIVVEMDYILRLWLHVPPPGTAFLCRLLLITFFIDRLTAGYFLAVQAHGKIAAYQATVGFTLLLTLPLAWILLKLQLDLRSIGIAFIVTAVATAFGRVLWGRHLFGIPISRWLSAVVWPITIVTCVAGAAALAPTGLMAPSFLRLVVTTVSSVGATLLTAWLFAFDGGEREFVREFIQRILRRILLQGE